jgi:hypothetical protein
MELPEGDDLMSLSYTSCGSIGCMTLGALNADAPGDGGHRYPHLSIG